MIKRDPQNQFLVAMVILVALHFIWPGKVRVSYPYNLLGLIPVISGIVFIFLGWSKLKTAGTTLNPYHEPEKLITDGIFKYTRNPIYLGYSLILCGSILIFATIPAIILAVVYIANTRKYNVLVEEATMLNKFGKVYEEYSSRTRRWI